MGMNTTTAAQSTEATVTIPCGWCDTEVIVSDDHGQVVYCSESHQQADRYIPEAEGNI